MVSCEIVSGDQITPLIWVYLPSSTMCHLPDLEEALNRFPRRDTVVLGDLNAGIFGLKNPRGQQVAEFLGTIGLVDLLGHFCQHLHYRCLQMW